MHPSPTIIRRISQAVAGPKVLAVLVVWMLHRSLNSDGALLPTLPRTDLFTQFIPWRYFAFTQWKAGHFPFWNPHVFCGAPFFADIQTCLLYPIAWIHFLFKTTTAVTLEATLDLYAAAFCTYLWARQRKISRCGSTLAGTVFTFSGPVYLHLMPGHLTILAACAWMPLIFLAVDHLLTNKFSSGILIGSAALCLQCLGGHAQLVYYTLLVAGVYLLLALPQQPRIYLSFAALCFLGISLAAIQLFPTYRATALSTRAGGVTYEYASMVSLPPENLLTAIIPYPFGDMATIPYLGRWYLWEMSLYIGIVPLILTGIALANMDRTKKWRMLALLATSSCFFILGAAFSLISFSATNISSGFALFRGASKFNKLWALMLAILTGTGWDHLRNQTPTRRLTIFVAIVALACIALAVIIASTNPSTGLISTFVHLISKSTQYYVSPRIYSDPRTFELLRHWMTRQWITAAILLSATALLLYFRKFSVRPAYILLVLAIADVYSSSAQSNATSPYQLSFSASWMQSINHSIASDTRVAFDDMLRNDTGDLLGYNAIWGYDTQEPHRYAQLIAATQGHDLLPGEQYYFNLQIPSPVLRLLRCQYILRDANNASVETLDNPMPHICLIGRTEEFSDEKKLFRRLFDPSFDYASSAIVEERPDPAPTPQGAAGHATILSQSINNLEIQADLPAPALLLITDNYAPGWHVAPMEANKNQSTYNVLRADGVLRAIPLAAGHHHFDLRYSLPGLFASALVTAGALAAWIGTLIFCFVRKLKSTLVICMGH